MKISTLSGLLLVSTANALNVFGASKNKAILKPIDPDVFTIDTIPGALPPFGIFDPAGLAARADEPTLKRYREAELTHGRVSMLATVGFLAGEKVEGSSFLFDASIRGPAISHLSQVPPGFWFTLTLFITLFETDRAKYGWVPPRDVDVDKPGLLRAEYIPGDLGFDPLRLRPDNPVD